MSVCLSVCVIHVPVYYMCANVGNYAMFQFCIIGGFVYKNCA